MKYAFSACTDQGRVRSNNEDAVSIDHQAQVAVLADGMGGYNAGEVASHMATEIIRTQMANWLAQAAQPLHNQQVYQALVSCVEHANTAIFQAAHNNAQYSGMGTTVVACVLWEDQLMLAHVGDSRGYRLRAGELLQITRDHSWLQEQIDAGLITPKQAAQSGQRNLVTRALGVEEDVQVECNDFAIEPQDLYLLCSDGLSEMVKDADLRRILNTDATLEEKAQQLVDMANAHGGRDNISVVLIYAECAAPARKRSLVSRLLGTA